MNGVCILASPVTWVDPPIRLSIIPLNGRISLFELKILTIFRVLSLWYNRTSICACIKPDSVKISGLRICLDRIVEYIFFCGVLPWARTYSVNVRLASHF